MRHALLLAVSLTTGATQAADKPNFVFIIADDCTFRDMATYGGQAHTPHTDQLAKEGMKFQNCFQAAPMCSPTRHNIYTGQYPVKTGAYPNHTFAKDGTQSIVHYLKPLGYRVALSGKTHISPREVFPFEYSGQKNNPDMNAIEKLFAESIDAGNPFCLFACSNEPHTPWNKGDASRYPPEEVKLPPYIADTPVVRENFSRYLAEITYFDDQVGQILSLLDKHDLRDSTMVVVVSEQGNAFPFAKWTCYDMGLHSAMVVRWPGKVAPGSVSSAMVEYCDITPTFVDAAGGKPAPILDGQSFLPVLRGQTDHHKDYVYGLMTTRGIINGSDCFPIRTVRDKEFRLIWNPSHETQFTNACTRHVTFQSMLAAAKGGDERARRVTQNYQVRPEWELYDVRRDPLEQSNLYGQPGHAENVTRLRKALDEWMTAQGDKGIETELDARNHQRRNRKNKPGSKKKKK
jgi:uncharacterized sulfatase